MVKQSITSIWGPFKTTLTRIGLGISGKEFPIVDILPFENEIGYTDKSGVIHLSCDDKVMDGMDKEHKLMFIKGVFGHELMHQLDSDFAMLEKTALKLPEFEREIFCTIANIMEDPSIEYWASHYYGGHLLRALKYSIMTLYKGAPPLEDSKTAFVQFLNAYIQYGDGGFLNGEFTFPEAKEYFYKALPLFDKAIEEPNGTKRIEYAEEVFRMTKPLWIHELKNKEDFEKLKQQIKKLMSQFGKNAKESGGKPIGDVVKEKPDKKGKKEKRRNNIRKKIGAELEPEGLISEGFEDIDEDEDVDFIKEEPAESESIDDSEFDVQDKDLEQLRKEMSHLREEAVHRSKEKKLAVNIDDCTPDLLKKYPSVKCNNIVPKSSPFTESQYQEEIAPMLTGIRTAVSQLKRLFAKDRENIEHKTSGKVNVKRLTSGRKTARVFDKRIQPSNKSDVAIEILVDISGSMYGTKIELAKQSVIGLAEIFGQLKIPSKVMAFTADIGGYAAVHYHFLNWHNTPIERRKLLRIKALNNNFDGYSIRYAGKEISKRPEQHKLIIVISDGEPLCNTYGWGEKGVVDTTDAIREASQKATVIGVAIDADAAVLQKMYGKHFIYIKNIGELFPQLVRLIQKEIASW